MLPSVISRDFFFSSKIVCAIMFPFSRKASTHINCHTDKRYLVSTKKSSKKRKKGAFSPVPPYFHPLAAGPASRRQSRPGVADCGGHGASALAAHGRDGKRRGLPQAASSASLLSTTFTKPTGTAMTRAGRSPASISSTMASRAVGALPTARMARGAPAPRGAWRPLPRWFRSRLRSAPPQGPPCSRGHCRPAGKGKLGNARKRHVDVSDDGSSGPEAATPAATAPA